MFKIRTLMPCCRLVGNLTKATTLKSNGNLWNSLNQWQRLLTSNETHALLTTQQQRRWYTSEASEKDEKLKDFSEQERVYYGSLTPRMRAVKVFSLTTSLAGLAAQPVLMEQGMKLGGTGVAIAICSFAGFFTFVTPFLLHFITKKYVTEIHYNPKTEEYTATTISIILKKIHTKFRPNDVKVPEVPGMFTSFIVNKKPLFVDPVLFDNPEHFVRIMGYDKPIDFKLDLKNNETPKSDDLNKK